MTESNKWLLSLSSVDRDVPNILITPVRFFLLLDKKKGWKEGKLLVAARWRWRGKTYFRLCLELLFPSSRYSIYLILSYPARSLAFFPPFSLSLFSGPDGASKFMQTLRPWNLISFSQRTSLADGKANHHHHHQPVDEQKNKRQTRWKMSRIVESWF